MTRIDVLSYELLDQANTLLAEFKQMTVPNQIIDEGVAAWQYIFGFQLMIDKSLVMVNNRVAAELDEAYEILTNLVNDLTKACSKVRPPFMND